MDGPNHDAPSDEENRGEDYYFDGPYLVFTAAYHLKRGFCCQSGCRHCPYGFQKPAGSQALKEEA
jgi:hypothetical protein